MWAEEEDRVSHMEALLRAEMDGKVGALQWLLQILQGPRPGEAQLLHALRLGLARVAPVRLPGRTTETGLHTETEVALLMVMEAAPRTVVWVTGHQHGTLDPALPMVTLAPAALVMTLLLLDLALQPGAVRALETAPQPGVELACPTTETSVTTRTPPPPGVIPLQPRVPTLLLPLVHLRQLQAAGLTMPPLLVELLAPLLQAIYPSVATKLLPLLRTMHQHRPWEAQLLRLVRATAMMTLAHVMMTAHPVRKPYFLLCSFTLNTSQPFKKRVSSIDLGWNSVSFAYVFYFESNVISSGQQMKLLIVEHSNTFQDF